MKTKSFVLEEVSKNTITLFQNSSFEALISTLLLSFAVEILYANIYSFLKQNYYFYQSAKINMIYLIFNHRKNFEDTLNKLLYYCYIIYT